MNRVVASILALVLVGCGGSESADGTGGASAGAGGGSSGDGRIVECEDDEQGGCHCDLTDGTAPESKVFGSCTGSLCCLHEDQCRCFDWNCYGDADECACGAYNFASGWGTPTEGCSPQQSAPDCYSYGNQLCYCIGPDRDPIDGSTPISDCEVPPVVGPGEVDICGKGSEIVDSCDGVDPDDYTEPQNPATTSATVGAATTGSGPTCLQRGDPCSGDSDCCGGLCCGDFEGCC